MIKDADHVRRLLGAELDPALRALPAGNAARDELLNRILHDPLNRILHAPEDSVEHLVSARPSAPARSRFLPRGVTLAALAAGAVVVTLALIGRPIGGDDVAAALPIRPHVVIRPLDRPESPRDVLERAASAAAAGVRARGSGPIHYTKLLAAYLHTAGGPHPASVLVPETVETWWSPDGSAEIRHDAAAPIWPSHKDHAAWDAAAPAPSAGTRTEHIDNAAGGLDAYPTDPAALAHRLASEIRGTAADRPGLTFKQLREIRNSNASPALVAATYRVAATLPGLRTFGAAIDQLGRHGIAVGLDSDYSGKLTRYELIVDPASGRVLEYQELLLEHVSFLQAQPPVQIAFEINAHEGYVSQAGVRR